MPELEELLELPRPGSQFLRPEQKVCGILSGQEKPSYGAARRAFFAKNVPHLATDPGRFIAANRHPKASGSSFKTSPLFWGIASLTRAALCSRRGRKLNLSVGAIAAGELPRFLDVVANMGVEDDAVLVHLPGIREAAAKGRLVLIVSW
jgi:hypothetical protein